MEAWEKKVGQETVEEMKRDTKPAGRGEGQKNRIDYGISGIPFIAIVLLCFFFFIFPENSNRILSGIRNFLGTEFAVYYLGLGLFIFLLSLYISFSSYGDIVLGEPHEKPKYSFFTWGSMMFTAGLAADIMFYSFCEWILYVQEPYVQSLGRKEEWATAYTLFHWGLIPWGFYLVLAAAFGFMLHVRKRNKQRYSEACRPILKGKTDGILGRGIDILAVFALLAGTATTFSVATPLMAEIMKKILPSVSTRELTLLILVVTCAVYTFSLLKGMMGISLLGYSTHFYSIFFLQVERETLF